MVETKQKKIYMFLDECLIVGGLLKYLFEDEKKINHINETHEMLARNFETSKKIADLIKDLYQLPTKFVVIEDQLFNALDKIKNRKEYKEYLNKEKLEKLIEKIEKRKYTSNNQAEYQIKFDGIALHIVKKFNKKYEKIFNEKYNMFFDLSKKYKIFDCGDLNLLKSLLYYSIEKNGRGFYILLTVDRKIIKKFSSILNRFFRNKIFIIEPEDLYTKILLYYNELNKKREKERANILILELLYHSSAKYIISSVQKNNK